MNQETRRTPELKNINVLIADGHSFHRKGLISILSGYKFIEKCDQAENGSVALECLRQNYYDIVFLEIDIPKIDGMELARIIKRDFKRCKIIVLTANHKKLNVYEFIEMGVSAYLFKNYTEKKITQAFEKVLDGDKYISSEISDIYNDYKKENNKPTYKNSNDVEITNTEKRIISLMCEQLTSTQISAKLAIGKSTVDTHRKRLFKKLKVVNFAGVIIYAVKTGLFKPWEME